MLKSSSETTTTPRKTSRPNQPGRLMLLPPATICAEALEDGQVLAMSDLRQFAEFLAREFGFDNVKAAWEPASWYQEQVGNRECSSDQAELLREMTIDICRSARPARPALAESSGGGRTPPRGAWDELWNGLGFLAIMCALFAFLCFAAGHGGRPDEAIPTNPCNVPGDPFHCEVR